ncbi:MAG TPA: nicotinate (nicotinamide) nucleotide adenylyltransferase [Phycisphaerae bacterium]|nr:nicotinate (nicotinamide) nucleotide adenylyltransferase [Phycisphaerae bacterium]
MAEQKILFGGTFDPVHFGHLIIARSVAETLNARRVVLIPACTSPFKNAPVASAEDRLSMLQLATEGEELFDICDLELRRTPPSYTIQTVEQLLREQEGGEETEFSLVIGGDMLADLPKWHRVDDLLRQVRVLVVPRPPFSRADVEQEIAAMQGKFPPRPAASLNKPVISTPLIDISSTEIRRRQAAGLSIRYLLPEPVRDYIVSKRLYAPV